MKHTKKVLFISKYFTTVLFKWAVAIIVMTLLIAGPIFILSYLTQ